MFMCIYIYIYICITSLLLSCHRLLKSILPPHLVGSLGSLEAVVAAGDGGGTAAASSANQAAPTNGTTKPKLSLEG